MDEVAKVMEKKEFSQIPKSIVKRALEINHYDIKTTRALLRKYIGVFLTNKVIKGKGDASAMLLAHKSSQKRDYSVFYPLIHESVGNVGSVIDLGCGANGYSYPSLKKTFGDLYYLGIEAAGQLVTHSNAYFNHRGLEHAQIIQGDLYDLHSILLYLRQLKQSKPRLVFLFQVIDALESFERNFSKTFLSQLSQYCEYMVITLPLESLSKRKNFEVQRTWFTDFLQDHFTLLKDTKMFGERILIIQTHKKHS